MKKIKLNKSDVLDSALTREQLKGIMGGSGSGSITLGCSGKSEGASCYYERSGTIYSGYCHTWPFAGLICVGS